MTSPTTAPARTPREIIDLAVAENRRWEWLCYGLVVLFAAVGAAGLVYGMVAGGQWPTVGGASAGAITVPLLYYAIGVWRANVALRVLEASLSDPAEAKKTFEAVRAVYLSRITGGKK